MPKLNSRGGHAALSVCHMAGMIDLAALPLWIGTLMKSYGLQAPQAGLTVTVFLGAVVIASVTFAPMFTRLRHALFALCGFSISALAFLAASLVPVSQESLSTLLVLHAIAGSGAGAGLSVTHGAIGRTANPHRLFGIVNVAMGVLAIIMFATLPGIISALGGRVIFRAFAVTMGVAAIVSLLFFPSIGSSEAKEGGLHGLAAHTALPKVAWLTIGTIVCLSLNQATVFSYVERIGVSHGFGEDAVQGVLVLMGFINLAPGILAALLQQKLSPLAVGLVGLILQAVMALSMTTASTFVFYAAPAALYVSLVIFSHTFLFGLLSKVDRSGRAVAATPAMMMSGSAMGPILGGGVVALVGYPGLGWVVLCIAAIAVMLILLTRRELARAAQDAAPAVA